MGLELLKQERFVELKEPVGGKISVVVQGDWIGMYVVPQSSGDASG
jgi:hypothetical protein